MSMVNENSYNDLKENIMENNSTINLCSKSYETHSHDKI